MKKISIQIKVGLLLIITVVLLSATCYISYRNLSLIVTSIRIEVNPEQKLLSIREISGDLEKADYSVHIYTITRDSLDLKPYFSIITGIDEKFNNLRQECIYDAIMLNQLDTISNLIEENIVIWNELLYLINNDDVVGFLKHLSDQINYLPDKNEKKGILKRIFIRNSKNILDKQELINNIQKIERKSEITKEKLKTRELQLAGTSTQIKERFYTLITRMENEVSSLVREKDLAANKLAERTYNRLIIFSISGGLLVILVLYIIIRYIRNTHAYQVALERSKIETENLSRTRELFMANMSHEIRTPVTAISGFTGQLLHENLDENVIQSLKIIKSSSDHLAKIIDDILDLSKLQNGKLRLEKVHFSIEQIFSEVCDLFEKQSGNNNTDLSYSISEDTPPILLGDPYRLKQIMINLVGNSVKFTEAGSVHFSGNVIKKQSGGFDLVIEVADTGIGIDEDKLKIIFEDFTQAEASTSRKYGGTGLGLSIVKKLVDLQKGHIECESRKNQGTKISCYLPFQIGLENKIVKDLSLPLSIPEEIKNLKILIVDDEEYNRLLFKKILDRWDIKYEETVNGMEALKILKENRYDIVFMDIRMPGLDGLETTRFIRNKMHITEAEMKVICISAAPVKEEWETYRQSGMNAFLQKPFTEEMLLNTILALRENNTRILSENLSIEVDNKTYGTNKINLRNLRYISGGDDQFVKQMLDSFNQTTNKGLQDMLEAASSGQLETVADLAHKMLSPCRHIGALELYNLLGKIEQTILKKSDIRTIKKLITQSISEFEGISELLNKYIDKVD